MNAITENTSLGQIVTDNPLTAHLFHQLGMDFCCGGGISLEDACGKKKLNTRDILEKLEAFRTPGQELQVTSQTRAQEIIEYIINRFHEVHRSEFPALTYLADKVARVHGDAHPELHRIKALFDDLLDDVQPHMLKEEQVLFPFIRDLENSAGHEAHVPRFHCGSVNAPITQMEREHEAVGDILRAIREASHDFHLPAGACNSYRSLYAGLEKLEYDLHLHIHYENNILHPMALGLENQNAGSKTEA